MNWLSTLIDSPVIERLGWTLVHSLWQGLAVAIVLALALPALRRRGARAAYGVCCGALLLTVSLPAATFCVLPESRKSEAATSASSRGPKETTAAERPATVRSLPIVVLREDESVVSRVNSSGAPANVGAPSRASRHDSSIEGRVVVQRLASVASPPDAPTVPARAPVASAPASLSWKDWAAGQARQLRERLSVWLPWAVLAWSVGVVALSLWNLGGLFAVRRLKLTGTTPAPSAVQQAAVRIAQKLGLTRRVRLVQSALVDSPVVIGALKPVILLPASLITEIPADQLESLLAHELAHVLRHDYLVNLVQSAIETLLFYHPAVWWISAQVRTERENCCDDLAIAVASNRAVYVRALATVAGARTSQMVPAATGGALIARVRRILGVVDPVAASPSRWLTGVVILSLCGLAIAFFAVGSHPAKAQAPAAQAPGHHEQKKQEVKSPQQNAAQAKSQPSKSALPKSAKTATRPRPQTTTHPQFPTTGQMRLKIFDSAGKPVPEAFIQVSIWTDEPNFRHNRNYKCDPDGQATIKLPKTFWILRIWAKKRGYCEEFKNFEPNAQIHEIVLPDEFAFHLVADTTLRGTVKNEEGQPVPQARVECYRENRASLSTETDDQGHWTIAGVRPGSACEVQATHPDYLGNEPGRRRTGEKLTARATPTDVPTIVLRRGVRLTVRTTDPAGKPVQGAVVIWGDDPYMWIGDTAVVADENGSCRLPAFGEGPMRVTVVAKGWMPDSKMVELKRQMEPVDFRLKPGRKLRVRFVDGSGAAVPGVGAWVDKWRGIQNLHSNVNGHIKIEIPGKADDKGIYEWDWAPDDAVSFSFSKRGFAGIEQTITADGKEHVLTINHVLQITGTVRDAVTGNQIDDFLVVPILHFRPDFPSLDRSAGRQQKNGVLAMQFDRTDIAHGVQIEAPGYKTFRTTERYRVGGPDPVLDVRLQPAAHYTGTVVGPDGRSVKGAHVSVSSRLEQLDDGFSERQRDYNGNNRVHTDGNGKFEIAAQLDHYDLVAIAPDGFAEVNRQPDQLPGEIRLQRWASLTGRLVESEKPVADCDVFVRPIRLSGSDEPHNFSQLTAKTAADGSFTFPRIPPVPCHVEAFLHWGVKSQLEASSRSVPINPAPGEKLHVELGAGGIEITGQLVAENQPPGFDYHFALNYLVARRPGIEPPAWLAGKGFDWRKGWSDSWGKSPEGRAYLNTLHSWFVKPEPNGRFRISGVEPGTYDFAVNLYGSTEGCLVHPISTGVVHFTVKPGEKQLDLGKVSVPSFTLPKVGDLAADFEFTTPDGGKSHLAALRGKYVLVDFWATWCGPCVAKLDEIERLRKEFRADKELVVIGANLDSDTERAREFLKSKPLPWQHALLGDWSNTDVPRRYAVSSVPAYVLIDPDGRILATEFSLETIETKLKALGGKPGGSPAKTEKPQARKATPSTQMAVADSKPPKADSQPGKAVERAALRTHGQMRVDVVDEGDKPLAEAVVRGELATPDDLPDKRTYKCDAQGRTIVELPEAVSFVRLYASKPGFCTEQKGFWPKNKTDHSFIRDDHQFRLVRPIKIGGVVKDEEGRPVAGARLVFSDLAIVERAEALTDAKGRWQLDARPDKRTQLNRVTHPDYLANTSYGEHAAEQNVTSEALYAQTSVVVMKKGISVRGKVTDSTGKPVPDAIVVWGHGGKNMATDRCHTDEAGQFRFQVATTGPQKVAVVAKGWMLDMRAIVMTPGLAPIDFQLKPGKTLRLRIVDRAGAPVPGVQTSICAWRGAYLIDSLPYWGSENVDIPQHTDKEGRLEWSWAPDDPVSFNLYKQGYANGEVTVTADGREQTRTINSLFHISGSVVDAKTGRPIDNFDVVPVEYWAGTEIPNIWRRDVQRAAAGQFDLEFNRQDSEHCVQIEARGYKTYRDGHRYRTGDPNPEVAVRLEPGDRYRGRILGPNGQPASGAQILLQSWSEGGLTTDFADQLHSRFRAERTIQADRDGAFEIPAPIEPYVLQVVSPDGYAEVDRAASEQPGDIRIMPWARVTGRLLQSGKPVANASLMIEPIRIHGTGLPRAFSVRAGKTNADGTFVLDTVPPIPSRIHAFLHFSTPSELKSSASVPLALKPGETIDVTLGGNGSEVTGRFAAENQPANFDYHFALNYLVAKRPGIEPPKTLTGKDFDWNRGWSDAWRSSAEGTTYLNTLEHWFVKPEPDGRFRISGVPPGEYDLGVALYGATEGCLVHPVSSGVVHISVKPGQIQLELGKLSIASLVPPQVGDLAGAFEFQTPDGTKTSAAAFRGSYVLIDFWATWCGPCVAKLDSVEHLRHEFAGEHPLVVIGANLDADTTRAREFLKSKPLPWQHALLGDWANTDVPRRYAVSSVPAYVLIDPEGRILANEYSLDTVEAKLKTLEKK